MSRVRIVIDSTAYLPKEKLEELLIEVVPLYVNFPDEMLVDGKIENKVFFEKMKKSAKLPFTSQPSPVDFIQVYENIIKKGDEIISIHISSGISGTVGSAATAAEMLDKDRISVIDSLSTSGGLWIRSVRRSIAASP